MGYVNMRIIFLCPLFTFTILAMEKTDMSVDVEQMSAKFRINFVALFIILSFYLDWGNAAALLTSLLIFTLSFYVAKHFGNMKKAVFVHTDKRDLFEQLDVTGNYFVGLKHNIHWLIFRYLALKEQGIYSKLIQKIYHHFRTPFLLLRTHELLFGLSLEFERILQTTERDELLQRRASVLKNDIHGFYYYVQMLMKLESDYTPEEQDIMAYVTKMKHDRKLTNWITFNDQEYSQGNLLFIYNFQDHTVEPRHKKDQPLSWPYNFKLKITMPLIIHYKINDQDHIDVFAENQNFGMHFETECITFITYPPSNDDFPYISFTFQFVENPNTITLTDVCMDYYPGKNSYPSIYYVINDDALSRQRGNTETMEIKSIITSNSLIQTIETNKDK